MHRIDTSTAQVDKFGAGKNGFTGGNPQTGEQATELNADFFDAIQEEVCAVVEGAGIAPAKGTRNQLFSAINKLVSGLIDSGALLKANNLSEIAGAGAAAQAAARSNIGAINGDGLLKTANNLSEILAAGAASQTAARANLALGSAAQQNIGSGNANVPDIQTADGRYLGKTATAAAAVKLSTSRNIAGVGFDGTGDISIPAGNVGAYTKAEVDAKINNTSGAVIGGRLGSATTMTWGEENTQVDAPAGYVTTGGNLDNSAEGTQWTLKPIQININGTWSTITG